MAKKKDDGNVGKALALATGLALVFFPEPATTGLGGLIILTTLGISAAQATGGTK